MRSRRVEVCSVTRWSSTITQSETYSSMPWRVSVPSPRSPVITAVTPRSLSQPNRRRSSERRIAVLENAPNSVSIVSITTRLAPTCVDRRAEPQEQRRRGPSRRSRPCSAADDARRGRSRACRRPRTGRGRSPARRRWRSRSSADSSNATNTPGSSNCGDAADEELHRRAASCRSRPDRRRASVVPGQAAAGHLVEPADAGRRLCKRRKMLACR